MRRKSFHFAGNSSISQARPDKRLAPQRRRLLPGVSKSRRVAALPCSGPAPAAGLEPEALCTAAEPAVRGLGNGRACLTSLVGAALITSRNLRARQVGGNSRRPAPGPGWCIRAGPFRAGAGRRGAAPAGRIRRRASGRPGRPAARRGGDAATARRGNAAPLRIGLGRVALALPAGLNGLEQWGRGGAHPGPGRTGRRQTRTDCDAWRFGDSFERRSSIRKNRKMYRRFSIYCAAHKARAGA